MPRGIPKSGKRASGGGRPKKYGVDTKQARVPVNIADKLSELLLFLNELNDEITSWEYELEGKDLKTNPRYSKAKVLTASIRERLTALDVDFIDDF